MLWSPKECSPSLMHFSIKGPEMNRAATTRGNLQQLHVLGFLVLCLLPFALAWDLTRAVSSLAFTNDSFSPILVVPFVSFFFTFENARLNMWHLQSTNQSALFVFATVLIWLGAFSLFFGTQSFCTSRFPLSFLLFSVPIPEPLLSYIISFLKGKVLTPRQFVFGSRVSRISDRALSFCCPAFPFEWRRNAAGYVPALHFSSPQCSRAIYFCGLAGESCSYAPW
jgi:hypothetical protein